MTDIPIIFSAAMIQALFAGRKTQTRRLAWKFKTLPAAKEDGSLRNMSDRWECLSSKGDGIETWRAETPWQSVKPGDRLWVKERLCSHGHFGFPLSFGPQVRAGDNARVWSYFADAKPDPTGGRPSIHCPRAFSRVTLVVTATKIEPLQKISEEDARAEGWPHEKSPKTTPYAIHPSAWFQMIWSDLHGAASWAENPEVVCLSFSVHQTNIDAMKEAA